MSSLPPEIITIILFRLPIKSLLRFRCVSKLCCSLIDSPNFITLHLTHSITTSANHSPIAESDGTLYSLDSDSLKNLVKIETPFINPYKTILFSTCNGLLLLGDKLNSQSLILFNPSTRKHLLLPSPPPESKYADLTSFLGFNCLGYDVINNDYKVFNVRVFVDQAFNVINFEARIYNLKSNLWRIDKGITKGMVFDSVFEAYVNGALHAFKRKDMTIIALDVGKEAFNPILMPNFEDEYEPFFKVHVFDGCLAILCLYPDDRTDIWVMKEYGVKESWSMLLSVKPDFPIPFVIPMVFSKSRTEILLSYDTQMLVWYDLKKKTVRSFEVSGLPIGFGQVCVESLVSIGGTTKSDEKKQHEEEK